MTSRCPTLQVSSPITVRILGRNRLLREALVRLLRKRAGFSVQDVYADAEVPAATCDCVLLTDSLSAFSPSDNAPLPSAEGCGGRILFFGMDDDRERFLDAVRLGAAGYLLSDASSDDIVQAIKMVARGEAVCPPRLCMMLFQYLRAVDCGPSRTEDNDARTRNLTLRQRQLMDLVSRGMTNKEIATRLNLSQFTVKNHLRRIMRHVEATTRHQAVDLMRAGGILPRA